MGKRIRVQRRGRGRSPTFKASTHKRVAPTKYPSLEPNDYFQAAIEGVIEGLVHEPGRGSPLALVKFENGETCYTVVPEGVHTRQPVQMGGKAPVEVGNIIPVGKIPEGTIMCNLELQPGDGGKIARSSGTYATVVGHTPQGTMIKLPSGKTRYLNDYCRATIGVVSGAGRTEKPFLKAGAKFHMMKAKGHKYPRTSGRAMIAALHPYGSSKKSARKVTTVSRHAPPGQKVGLIAARRAGQKKRRR
ncbi:50S ribosomal protein L2 [Candidatus Bathyarchaeota archaeon]|nr:50S ribosomal protein L2 [Candidatus Bathyarchaeota archaeon]MCK4434148.1 50S ribosomal protein L2 [Candidatus Bathyarchaeota archaeon]MCK4669229.1 50S ribosomal protein L2 [Candidatus Bathyarchaeota archaeon]